MSLAELASMIAEFVRAHQQWAAPIVFILAFLESLAFLSLLVPATGILLAIGALVGAAGVPFWPLWFAGGIGGVIGYSLSYEFGRYYGERAFNVWPFSSMPGLITRSKSFFDRFGVAAVFIGHFIGPIRAVIPVVAGVYGVKRIPFEIANILAAFIWITSVLAPGFLATDSGLLPHLPGLGK